MLLNDLIEAFSDRDLAGEAIAALDDLALVARIAEAAGVERASPSEYVRRAVDRYVASARDDEWLTLIAAMSRSRDPGETFLRRALASTLDRPNGVGC